MTRGHQQRAVQSEFGRQKQRRAGPTDMGMEICLHVEVAHYLNLEITCYRRLHPADRLAR